MSWALGSVVIVRNKVLHVLGLTIGAHREEQSFTCLGPYDQSHREEQSFTCLGP
jgi:hypothetical protein